MCTLITSKGTDIDENIANQNHATRTRTPKPGYLNLSSESVIPRSIEPQSTYIVHTDVSVIQVNLA